MLYVFLCTFQICYNVSQHAHNAGGSIGSSSSSSISVGSKTNHVPPLLDPKARQQSIFEMTPMRHSYNSRQILHHGMNEALQHLLHPQINPALLSTLPTTVSSTALLPFGLSNSALGTLSGNAAMANALAGSPATQQFPMAAMTAALTQQLGQRFPAHSLTQQPQLSSVVNGFGEPVVRDPTDPTDPDCAFARQLPTVGVSAMLQLSDLPLLTSRHDIRIYLGPANYSKIYRMKRMVSVKNS